MKKPHHSTVFRRKATGQINQLQRELRGYEVAHKVLRRQINDLDADKRTLSVKLSALATKLSSVEEGRNNLLKSNEEKQQTINRLQATLREIYEEASGVVAENHEEAAAVAAGAVREAMEYSYKLNKELTEAKGKIATQEDRLNECMEEIKRSWDDFDALLSRTIKRENSYIKALVCAVALCMIVLLFVIYNAAK